MGEIELVIKIPEEIYRHYKNVWRKRRGSIPESCIAFGTPLPKGHGDLKDMGNLKYVFDLTRDNPVYSGKDIEWAIKSMTTIIEADKESEDKK